MEVPATQLSPKQSLIVNWTWAASCKLEGTTLERARDIHMCRKVGTEPSMFAHLGSSRIFIDS